jgi:hypothetical protein
MRSLGLSELFANFLISVYLKKDGSSIWLLLFLYTKRGLQAEDSINRKWIAKRLQKQSENPFLWCNSKTISYNATSRLNRMNGKTTAQRIQR